ncbi:hypothetical protein [Caballeronia grimmiae]|uniref:Uncharacterized protein n=1 Tax=Caballeronia grimmiae TaxID=1071679 RepID=A0A069NGR7_9BURK|nr:hypothetical protein [Caballeronia grimmiae]KDR27593.1 hypothetical protein BG57_22930 [Caballeronia grimmiae]GGD83810.1 hypothetical protein GCM10010985_42910 [Caballeronia grimmiae]
MTTLSFENRDMLYSLSWYMSARQTALRAALSFRTQLSVTDQMDMRLHYSGYFLNLVAATELFRETTSVQPSTFETQLYSRLVFDGFQDGEANYSYIRELRNAVVHRGLNITSALHIDGNFPMVLAEPKVQNQSRKKTFVAFDKYLLHIIEKCESVVGLVMLDCLNAAGIFEAAVDVEATAAEYRDAIKQSHAMPDFAKAMALATEFKPEWAEAAHGSAMTKLREALAPCNATKPSLS